MAVILAVSPEAGKLEEKPRMTIPERELERVTGAHHFNGSAMVRHPSTGTYIRIAAPQHAYDEAAGKAATIIRHAWRP